MSTLAASAITVLFGAFRAVDNVSFRVETGTCVGLIGPNGAGKSTAFAALTGFEDAGGGRIEIDGVPVTAFGPARRARHGLGRTFQIPKEFSHLTVRENLMAAAPNQHGESIARLIFQPALVRRQEQAIRDRADEMLDFLNLGAVADETAIRLSGGQKKLLELGRVLMTDPRFILLDEPFAGVNPVLIGEISGRIKELAASGVGFFIVEHNLNALSALVSRIYAMDRGRVIAEGAPAEILSDETVRAAYMGGAL